MICECWRESSGANRDAACNVVRSARLEFDEVLGKDLMSVSGDLIDSHKAA